MHEARRIDPKFLNDSNYNTLNQDLKTANWRQLRTTKDYSKDFVSFNKRSPQPKAIIKKSSKVQIYNYNLI